MGKKKELNRIIDHKKTCIRNSKCEICKINYQILDDQNLVQCELCGNLFKGSNFADISFYTCKCLKDNTMLVCYKCKQDSKHGFYLQHWDELDILDILPDDLEYEYGLFTDDCCAITTKAVK